MMRKGITLLYVDDELINTQLFALNFEKYYNVLTVKSGVSGLQILRENPKISVVISDMKMPGMDGLEFITLAKKDFPNVIFFILTGYEINEEIEDALKNNLINRYFRKPFDIEEIESSVNEALDKTQ
jgi:two-component system response regulator (stage 0 sporulation protein F)